MSEKRQGSEGVDQHLVNILLSCAKGDVEYFSTTKMINKDTLLEFVKSLSVIPDKQKGGVTAIVESLQGHL